MGSPNSILLLTSYKRYASRTFVMQWKVILSKATHISNSVNFGLMVQGLYCTLYRYVPAVPLC